VSEGISTAINRVIMLGLDKGWGERKRLEGEGREGRERGRGGKEGGAGRKKVGWEVGGRRRERGSKGKRPWVTGRVRSGSKRKRKQALARRISANILFA